MSFTPIGKLLPHATARAGITQQVSAARVLDALQDIFQKHWGAGIIGRRCKPVSVQNKQVTLLCISAPLMQEIKLQEMELLAELNEQFGKVVVEKIRYLG